MKNRFPVEKYLIGPKVEKKIKMMNIVSGMDPEDATKSGDIDLEMMTSRFDPSN